MQGLDLVGGPLEAVFRAGGAGLGGLAGAVLTMMHQAAPGAQLPTVEQFMYADVLPDIIGRFGETHT